MPRQKIAHPPTSKNHQNHDLLDHLRDVAKRSRENGDRLGFGEFAAIAGWGHDVGKAPENFQAHVRGLPAIRPCRHPRIAALLFEDQGLRHLAYLLDHHHGGFCNYSDYTRRLAKSRQALTSLVPLDNEVRGSWFDETQAWVNARIEDGTMPILPATEDHLLPSDERSPALWLRMMHSCLVDADRMDTSAHADPALYRKKHEHLGAIPELRTQSLGAYQSMLERRGDRPLNAVRDQFFAQAMKHTMDPRGIFSLEMATGTGKTLTHARFAIEHAAHHNMERLIFLAPFLAIIEQNADVYRRLFGTVVEHHSNFQWENLGPEEIPRLQGAVENWDAPVIYSTTVQFFESLYSSRNSAIQKIHNIANSVIVIDEFQTLPVHLLRPIGKVLDELVTYYGCSVVLCSATAPVSQWVEKSIIKGYTQLVDPAINDQEILARVRVTVRNTPLEWNEVANEVRNVPQSMVILNLKAGCRELLAELKNPDAYHLSTALCPEHRRVLLREIRSVIDMGSPITLVATPVIEAGVDISFPVLWKQLSPLDRLKQGEGRTNREGILDWGKMVVFSTREHQDMPYDAHFQRATEETRYVLASHPEDPLGFKAIQAYYHRLYGVHPTAFDLPEGYGPIEDSEREVALSTSGEAFRLITTPSEAVLVPWGDQARQEKILHQERMSQADRRWLQGYSVPLYPEQVAKCLQIGLIEEFNQCLVWRGKYHERFGILFEIPEN